MRIVDNASVSVLWRVTLGVLLCLSLWATGPLNSCPAHDTLAAAAPCAVETAAADAGQHPASGAPLMRATVPDSGARAQQHPFAVRVASPDRTITIVHREPPSPALAPHARPHLRDIPLLI
jgi:hypothetical protein